MYTQNSSAPASSVKEPMTWRTMGKRHLAAVKALADDVHKSYPEDDVVFRERLWLYPAGCHILASGDQLLGYSIAHPWLLDAAPELNSLLKALPARPDTLYIHDIALAVRARGQNAARRQVESLVRLAIENGFRCLSLTAVNGTEEFWRKNGFSLSEIANGTVGLASYGISASHMVRAVVKPGKVIK